MSNNENVKFFICGDVKAPQRKNGDAAWDLFMPNLSDQLFKDLAEKNSGQPHRWGLVGAPQSEEDIKENKGLYLYVAPHEDILIPTYIKTKLAENVYLRIANKSGIATKQKFITGAECIDPSYQGIIHIHIFNASNTIRFIEFGQKLAQAIPEYFDTQEAEIFYDKKIEEFKDMKNWIDEKEFFPETSNRGEGGFGSTGIK